MGSGLGEVPLTAFQHRTVTSDECLLALQSVISTAFGEREDMDKPHQDDAVVERVYTWATADPNWKRTWQASEPAKDMRWEATNALLSSS